MLRAQWAGSAPGENEFPCQFKGVFVCPLEHERAGISQDGSVKTGRNLGRNLHSSRARQAIDHFRRGYRLGINPVDLGERAAALMVIDVDQELVFQSVQAGALDAVTLQDDGSLVVAVDAFRLNNFAGVGQRLINAGHTVAQNDVGLLAHCEQYLAAGQRRTDGIAIRPRMRCQHEPVALLDVLENLFHHKTVVGRQSSVVSQSLDLLTTDDR